MTSFFAVDPIAVVQLPAAVSIGPLSMRSVLKPRSGVFVTVAVCARASATRTIMRPFAPVHVAVVEEVRAVAVLLI